MSSVERSVETLGPKAPQAFLCKPYISPEQTSTSCKIVIAIPKSLIPVSLRTLSLCAARVKPCSAFLVAQEVDI